ncbi:hypothetical protein AK812_SmicGene27016 [Symbiodinium microadriaticum]|uniref:Uncharacterized protein n=1 Tax=Symbiodinium microadriaticum TaxID=2951 RepID=A0A1Q9D7W8_SYMMI|nr:hypothetical protein AK812_SmicGene27016 [Symbiodinium microadriaticum]
MIGNSGRIRVCNNDGQEEKSECRALQVQVVPHLEELVACSIPRAPVRDVRWCWGAADEYDQIFVIVREFVASIPAVNSYQHLFMLGASV